MKPSLENAVHLLHSASAGALATHSTQVPGYPFASALPFVPDEYHRPVFLLSSLAEHTKNLLANQRASYLVTSKDAQNVLTGPRMTIVGDVIGFDATEEWAARFIRYQPEAEQYLALGDFAFFRLMPKRTRYIAGFAQMGWIEEQEWSGAPTLSLADEAALLAEFDAALAPGVQLLGIDCYGFDAVLDEKRERRNFSSVNPAIGDIADNMKRMLAAPRPE